jgi:hypothetical protein
MFTLGAR